MTKHVLIVDDEAAVTLTLAGALEKLGDDYVIDTVNTGEAALAQMTAHPYDLLITDYKMPGMNGVDLIQAVRRTSPNTHIIFMTAFGDDDLQATIAALGVDAYLDKPFNLAHIRELVECALPGDNTTPHILILEDTDDLRRLYTRALQRAGYEVHAAAALDEARALLQCHHFDAFLCDVHIGRDRGTDLLREQSQTLQQRGTQVVMVSADPQYRDVTEALGIEFYMEKPVDIVHLVRLVDRLTVPAPQP